MSRYYFAYGSNMNHERMSERGLQFDQMLSGRIEGLGLAFNKRAADAPHRSYANVIYQPGCWVEGILYRLIDDDQIVKMDPFEGAPRLYSRELFMVSTHEGELPGWVYVANRAMIDDQLAPERWYLDHLLAGRDYLSDSYYRDLQRTVCVDDDSVSQDQL